MKLANVFQKYGLFVLLAASASIVGCSKDDDDVPEKENEVEVITDVKLVFTNTDDPKDIVEASAKDPDGMGVEPLAILGELTLKTNTSYELTYEIMNNLETPGEDIGLEIAAEDDEHQFFFSFSSDVFATPSGDGNIDVPSDPINYADADGKGNPLGLRTNWTTASNTLTNGTFKVRLQHQPEVKTSTSSALDGDTDFELEFVLNIQ